MIFGCIPGVYLLSGGLESVLVIWQISTRFKQFLPHLPAPITSVSVSPSGTLYALGHLDNAVRIISGAGLGIKCVVQGLQYGMCFLNCKGFLLMERKIHKSRHLANVDRAQYPLKTGLVYNAKLDAVAMNGYMSSVQFYNLFRDRHVMEVRYIC